MQEWLPSSRGREVYQHWGSYQSFLQFLECFLKKLKGLGFGKID
jgi:hypothetical protein